MMVTEGQSVCSPPLTGGQRAVTEIMRPCSLVMKSESRSSVSLRKTGESPHCLVDLFLANYIEDFWLVLDFSSVRNVFRTFVGGWVKNAAIAERREESQE